MSNTPEYFENFKTNHLYSCKISLENDDYSKTLCRDGKYFVLRKS